METNDSNNNNKNQRQLFLEIVNVVLSVHIVFGYYVRAYLNIVLFFKLRE